MNVFVGLFEFVIITHFLPILLSLSLSYLLSLPIVCHFSDTQTGCEAEKDIKNVTSKGWMALADTSAKRKRGVYKETQQQKIVVLISVADYDMVAMWLPRHYRGGTIFGHKAKLLGNYRLSKQET